MKLYELTQNYLNLLELLENPDVPKDIVEKALEEVEGNFDDKAENIVKLIKSIEVDIKGYKEEESRLAANRRVLENKVTGLKEYLKSSMKALEKEKIKGKVFTLTLSQSNSSVVVSDFKAIPEEYIRKVEEADKKMIKEALNSGIEIPGVKLEKGISLRIK